MKNLIYIIISLFCVNTYAQKTCSNVVTSNNGSNIITLQKCFTTSDSPVLTGVPITYELSFSVTGNISNLNINDVIPSNMEFVSELSPNWLTWNNNPTNPAWTSASPPNGSYSISLSLRFIRGTTCNGDRAFNFATIEADDITRVSTGADTIPVIAKASDGWKIRKKARTNPILTGSNVTYDIFIYNSLGVNGSHNLNSPNITDLLPPGAILISQNCNFPLLDVTAPNSGSSVSTPYRCQITVQYPPSLFPAGSCPTNTVNLSGINPCDKQFSTSGQETICILDSIPMSNSAYLNKSVFMTNKVPGCPGKYFIDFQNTGNSTINDFVLSDVFPSGIEVTNLRIENFNSTNFTYTVTGGNCTPSSPTSATVVTCSGTPAITSFNIYPTSLAPNERFRVTADFELRNIVTSGQIITNTTTLSSTSTGINLNRTANLTVENLKPKLKIRKEICPITNSTYRPGDIFTYRIRFQNYGSQNFTGGTLEDILDSRLDYLGNVKVYRTNAGSNSNPTCSGSLNAAPGTTDIINSTNVGFNATTNTLAIGLPNIPQNCNSFFYGGYNTINALETYIIEFDVRVKPGTPPGQIHNKAKVYNTNYSFNSNQKTISINSLFELKAEKFISIDGGSTYTQNQTSVMAGSNIKYKLVITNSGNMTLKNIRLVDVLPNIGDKNIQICIPRGSTINTSLTSGVQTSSNLNTEYSNVLLPDVTSEFGSTCPGSINPSWNSTFSGSKSIKIKSLPTFNLTPLATETVIFEVKIPNNATSNDEICNNFSIKAESINGTPTQLFSSNSVCTDITQLPPPNFDCCKTPLDIWNYYGTPDPLPIQSTFINSTNLSYAEETFELHRDASIPITELKVNVTDIQFEYNYEQCAECVNNPVLWGSIISTDNTIGTLPNVLTQNPNWNLPALANLTDNGINQREIIWKNPNGAMLKSGDTFNVSYLLPPASDIPCCATKVKICTKISWKDANCNVCEIYTCSDIDIQEEPITEKDLSIVVKKEGCCDRVLTANTNANATYKWNNGSTSKSITVSENGSYNVTVTAGGSSVTKTVLVTDIMSGAFPLLSFNSLFHPDFVPPYKNKFYIMDISPGKVNQGVPNSYNANEYKLEIWHRWNTQGGQGNPLKTITGTSTECNGFNNWDIFWDGTFQSGASLKDEKADSYVWRLTLKNCTNESSRLTYRTTFNPKCGDCVRWKKFLWWTWCAEYEGCWNTETFEFGDVQMTR